MAKEKENAKNLNHNLERLSKISQWFDNQEEVDIEEGLKKIKEASILIKASKKRLQAVENEFKEIKKEIDEENSKEEI